LKYLFIPMVDTALIISTAQYVYSPYLVTKHQKRLRWDWYY